MDNQSRQSECLAAFDAHAGRVRRLVAGMGFCPADRDDILQDVFMAASEQGQLPAGDEAGRWLMRVAVNRCLNEFRKRKRFTRAVTELVKRQAAVPKPADEPHEQAIRAEEFEMVRRRLKELDGPHLAAMVLTYYCGLNSVDVGEILQANPSTVRSWLREGRMRLAEGLFEKGFEP